MSESSVGHSKTEGQLYICPVVFVLLESRLIEVGEVKKKSNHDNNVTCIVSVDREKRMLMLMLVECLISEALFWHVVWILSCIRRTSQRQKQGPRQSFT